MAKESRAKSAMGGKSGKRTGKPVHHMHIRRGKSGGFVVEHPNQNSAAQMMSGADSGPEQHSVPDLQALHAHLDSHMGDQPAAGTQPEEGEGAMASQMA
jgi:hypothetical protein